MWSMVKKLVEAFSNPEISQYDSASWQFDSAWPLTPSAWQAAHPLPLAANTENRKFFVFENSSCEKDASEDICPWYIRIKCSARETTFVTWPSAEESFFTGQHFLCQSKRNREWFRWGSLVLKSLVFAKRGENPVKFALCWCFPSFLFWTSRGKEWSQIYWRCTPIESFSSLPDFVVLNGFVRWQTHWFAVSCFFVFPEIQKNCPANQNDFPRDCSRSLAPKLMVAMVETYRAERGDDDDDQPTDKQQEVHHELLLPAFSPCESRCDCQKG